MIEVYAHNYLKSLLKKDSLIWPHNLTLSRLVARSLRREDKSIFQLDGCNHNDYWPGLLIPLCLHSSGIALLVTSHQKNHLIRVEIPRLKEQGLDLSFWEGGESPVDQSIWILDYTDVIKAIRENSLSSRQLIIPEAELLSRRLRDTMAIKITSSNWDDLQRLYPDISSQLINLHEHLIRKLVLKAIRSDAVVKIDLHDLRALKDLLVALPYVFSPWSDLLNTSIEEWVGWAELNHKTLDWTWYLQPLEPLDIFHQFFVDNPFILLAASFHNELKSLEEIVDVHVKLGGAIHQEPIELFVPFRQPLPNAEWFAEHLFIESRRLVLGRKGLTIILLDDDRLLKQLTAELAAEFGKRVTYQSTTLESNGIVCCSSSWWLAFHDKLPLAEQLIVALLPFSSLELPLTAARVEAFKKQGLDWFRALLLPELLSLLPRLILPIRINHGRIAILDGRIRSRTWGKKIFDVLQPWTSLDRLLPD